MTDLEYLVRSDAMRWWNQLAPDIVDVTENDIVDIYWSCYFEDMMENQHESIRRQG